MEVTLQRLRERTDFADIARHLLRAIDPEMRLTERAVERLARQEWNGNMRELRAVLSRLTLSDRGGAVADNLPSPCDTAPRRAAVGVAETDGNLHELQRARVLAAHSWAPSSPA